MGLFDDSIYDSLANYKNPVLNTASPFSKQNGTPNSVLKAGTQPFNSDPIIQRLNTLYDYTPPGQTAGWDEEFGSGWDFTRGAYGSWDIGNKKVLAPVHSFNPQDNGFINAEGVFEKSVTQKLGLNPDVSPITQAGGFNADGWAVKTTESGATKHIIGTIGVIGAAVGSYLFGPVTAGVSEIAAGSEGLMIGSLAESASPAISGAVTSSAKTLAGKVASNVFSGSATAMPALSQVAAIAAPATLAVLTNQNSGGEKVPTVSGVINKTVESPAQTTSNISPVESSSISSGLISSSPVSSGNNSLLIIGVILTGLYFMGAK